MDLKMAIYQPKHVVTVSSSYQIYPDILLVNEMAV
jgi:hypothetical protein